MKKYFEKTSIALIIAMMFILAIFGGEAMKTHTIDDIAKYKMVVNAQGVKTENGTRTTTQVELGNYISLGKYNGKDIVWRCVSIDEKGALMLADNVIDTLPYDAKTNDNNRSKSHSRNYNRDNRGSNYWKDSNMRSWLNSTAVAGEVKWLCGNPPREDSVNGNAYDQKAGFLNDFSKAEIAAMKNVTQRSIVSHPEYNLGFHDGEGRSDLEFNRDIENVANNFDSAYGENSTEKVFLLDVKQVNTVWKNFGNYYIARNEQGTAWPYWLRTPYSRCNHLMRYVESSGSIETHFPMTDYMGVRPAFYLDSDYYVTTSGDGSASNPYVGSAPDKIEDDYTVAEPEEDPNQEWDISLDQSLNLKLGPYYSSDGKYSTPTIPVYTIQKTRSDTENIVMLICGEGYTKSQQQKFIDDVKKVWEGAMQYEPYRSYADRFNVYALCTASESGFNSGGSTFFDVVIDKKSGPMISVNKSAWKNHIFERCIGPAFLEQIHDAHIPNKTDPDTFIWDDDKMYPPFYYVHEYINQFAVLVNTAQDFGGSHRNYKRGIHYLITPSDSARAQKTFTHELGHGLLELGDEYMTTAAESTDYTSLNVTYTHDPEKVKWKKMLGFRKTFTCHTYPSYTAYNSSWECLMRDTTYQFCEVCKLQGSKRMSQLIDGKSLYVAAPEVKKYTGQYSKPSDFADTTYNGYANFAYYRSGVLLSGWDKNKFNTGMAGEKIQLRTIVQNLSDTTQRYVTMKMWIKRADGSVATTTDGQKLETTQTFTIPVWSEKSKFWPKGALSYEGSNMNSGLENCELIYQIPLDANLKYGDTVAFVVTDENGNVLANDNTETQTYANINIEYKFEDGTPMPNANKAVIPLAVGSYINWTAAPSLYGHTLSRVEGLNQIVSGSGQTVTYYYNYVKASYNISVTDCVAKKGEDTVGYAQYGDIIKVTANTAPTGKVFDKWEVTGLDTTGMDLTKTEITFNMPANAVEIKATYREVKYNVSVTGGTGGGEFEEGASVTLTANTPGVGERFTGWTIEGISGLDTTQTSLTFNMPAGNVTAIANYEDIEYTVTVNGGTTNKAKAIYGASVTITADAPMTGKRFTGWTIDGITGLDTTKTSLTFNMPAGNVTATANYEDIEYTVTVNGGTADKAKAIYGETVTITATVPTGKRFVEWTSESGSIFADKTNVTTTFSMPANAVTATANYEDIEYTVNVIGGTADKAKAKYGESVTLTANAPGVGGRFVAWTLRGVSVADTTKTEITFNMPAGNVTAFANYANIGYTITVNGGTADKSEAIYGERVTITANAPATGKEFDKWVVTGITLTNEDLAKSTVTFGMPASNVTMEATYKDIVYQVTVENGTTTLDMATYQAEVTVTANAPDADEHFDKWEVTGLDTTGMDLTKTEIKFQMPAGNVTFKATYLRVTKYGIVIVDGTKDKEVAKAGETVTITANPAKPGKVFDKWTCETAGVTIEFVSATSSKTTFVMPAREIEIKAHFRDVSDAPSVEIKVEGGTGAGVYTQGESVTVTANEPAEGKVFKGWQDASGKIVSTDKSYTFNVTGEKTLTAVYDDMPSGGGEITPPAKKDGLSGGQIAGIAIGSVLLAGIGGFAVLWFAVKKKTFADLIAAIKAMFTKKK